MTDTFPFVDEDGTWIEILGQPASVPISAPVPALFLDRDGVVVVETHYLREVEKTELIPGAGATITLANQQGVRVVMVTNQGGIGRGLYGWAEFEAVQNKIKAELAAHVGPALTPSAPAPIIPTAWRHTPATTMTASLNRACC